MGGIIILIQIAVLLRYGCTILKALYIFNKQAHDFLKFKKSALVSLKFRRIIISACYLLNSWRVPSHPVLSFVWHAISCILGIVFSLLLFFYDSSFSRIPQALHAWSDTSGILCDFESAIFNRPQDGQSLSSPELSSSSSDFLQGVPPISTMISTMDSHLMIQVLDCWRHCCQFFQRVFFLFIPSQIHLQVISSIFIESHLTLICALAPISDCCDFDSESDPPAMSFISFYFSMYNWLSIPP